MRGLDPDMVSNRRGPAGKDVENGRVVTAIGRSAITAEGRCHRGGRGCVPGMGADAVGRPRPRAAGAGRPGDQPYRRPSDDRRRRRAAPRDRHQWIGAGSADPAARGSASPPGRRQPARRGDIAPLARAAGAGGNGRRARRELSGHRSAEPLRLRIPGPPIRHLLVSLPFRVAGTDGAVRPADHRPRRSGSDRLRSRACDRPVRSQPDAPAHHLQEAEAAARLFQFPEADAVRDARRPRSAAGRACRLGGGCGWIRPTSRT